LPSFSIGTEIPAGAILCKKNEKTSLTKVRKEL
jgi:hypothetical protein